MRTTHSKAFQPLVVRVESGLHELTGSNVRETRAEYKLLVEASRELRSQLAPHGRTRAWRVAVQLSLASLLVRGALGDNVAAYASFLKHFGPELEAAKSKGRSKGGMDFGSGR